MADSATGADALLCAKFETSYGVAPTGDFVALPFISTNFGMTQGLVKSDVLGFGRRPQKGARGKKEVGGEIAVPLCTRSIGFWLKLLLGPPVSTAVTGGDSHVFTAANLKPPSAALEIGHPALPKYFLSTGVKLNTLAINWADENTKATLSLLGQNEVAAATSSGGTPAAIGSLDRFSAFQGVVKKGGTALGIVLGGSVSISNELSEFRPIRPDGLATRFDAGQFALTGSLTVRFEGDLLLTEATDGTEIELDFGYSATDASLMFSLPKVQLPKPKLPIQGPGGIDAEFSWSAFDDGAKSLTATLINDIESYA